MEIERKFIVTELPGGLEHCSRHEIAQGYLSFEPEIRIRQKDETYYLTEKRGSGLVREEYEREITAAEYLNKKQQLITGFIEKTRYCMPLDGGLQIELDVYHGRLEGLQVAEVEFSTEDEALSFTPPEWFGRELTYDDSYKAKNLAKLETLINP